MVESEKEPEFKVVDRRRVSAEKVGAGDARESASSASVETLLRERIRKALLGEVVERVAGETAVSCAREIVKALGADRAARIGADALASAALIELRALMSLPMDSWPDEPAGVAIGRRLARKFGKPWWQFWK